VEKIAIFDVDYTITRKETLMELYKYSLKENKKNIIYIPRALISGLLYVMKIFDEKRVKECFLKFIENMNEKDLSEFTKRFYDNRLKNILYKDALEMMKKLKAQGYKIYLISASPEFYLNHLYSIKEVDKIMGTKFHVNEGKFLRKMDGLNCKGEEKVKRLKQFLKEEKIDVDFENSYMFSDSLSDKPLLDLVGRPYLINYKKKHKIKTLNWN